MTTVLTRAPEFTSSRVVSRDGTAIAYRSMGSGPGVVVLHGAMETSSSHTDLAEALAPSFTVHLPDRRGRGASGPAGPTFGVKTEVEDLEALLRRTGAERVFGVSSGALVCLNALVALPAIRKAALFEPPLMPGGTVPTALIARYDREIAEGRVAAALVTGMQAARLGPPFLRLMPRALLEWLTGSMIEREDRAARPADIRIRTLAPTLREDFAIVAGSADAAQRVGAISADVLLLGGEKSPGFLKDALDALATAMPRARRIELAGLDHSAAGNPSDPMTGRGAQPARVAEVLRNFFTASAE